MRNQMYPDRLSFPSIPNEPSQPSRGIRPSGEQSAFAEIYSEAMQQSEQETLQILSTDSPDSSSGDDPASFADAGVFAAGNDRRSPFTAASEFPSMREELLQHVAAIHAEREHAASGISPASALSSAGEIVSPESPAPHQPGAAFSSGVHRLISWLDQHAHIHSTHHCAASVRRAMEAAGMSTADRPPSGDAGDYGPFLLRHGAQVIPQASYEPRTGDIAVFDKTDDHPAGHIQIFDGSHWVSDFVQHGFSPYLDPKTTLAATVYRLSA